MAAGVCAWEDRKTAGGAVGCGSSGWGHDVEGWGRDVTGESVRCLGCGGVRAGVRRGRQQWAM